MKKIFASLLVAIAVAMVFYISVWNNKRGSTGVYPDTSTYVNSTGKKPEMGGRDNYDYDSGCFNKLQATFGEMKPVATFEQHPVDESFTGAIASLDLSSSFIARRFKTMISGALSDGVNFAGHYIIAEWGFTGVGGVLAVVDANDGKVYPFPYVANVGFEYGSDSNLLIIDPIDYIKESHNSFLCAALSGQPLTEIRPHYFLWGNHTFKSLDPKNYPPPKTDQDHLAP